MSKRRQHRNAFLVLAIRITRSFKIIPLLFIINQASSQGTDTIQTLTYPIVGIHVGAGTVSGARLGVQAKVSNHFSFECSYGFNVGGFVGLVDADDRLGLGINWYPEKATNFAVGLRFVYQRMLSFGYSKNIIAVDVGIHPFPKSRLNAFWRVGFGIGFANRDYHRGAYFVPNLDVGLSWNFF